MRIFFRNKTFHLKNTSDVNGLQIVVPKAFEGILPPSPALGRFYFEQYSFLGLKSCLRPGNIVFDIGSSYGVMSVLMAKIVGKKGKVFSFEANIDVIEKAKDLAVANGLEDNIKFNNFLVGNSIQSESDFYVLPGYTSVASSVNPEIANVIPQAIKKKVRTITIDDFCKNNNIHPDCVKVDIEGSEFVAISGMKKTLEEYKPHIVLETHGIEIDGIGGSLKDLMELLESHQYKFFDFQVGDIISGRDYAIRHVNSNSTFLASQKISNHEFVTELKRNLAAINEGVNKLQKINKVDPEIVELVNSRSYDQVIKRLQALPLDSDKSDEQYYLAFSLHSTGLNYEEALSRYNVALKNGFPPFWIYYNRGSLYYKIGKIEKARDDLQNAEKIDSNHIGVRKLLISLNKGRSYEAAQI